MVQFGRQWLQSGLLGDLARVEGASGSHGLRVHRESRNRVGDQALDRVRQRNGKVPARGRSQGHLIQVLDIGTHRINIKVSLAVAVSAPQIHECRIIERPRLGDRPSGLAPAKHHK
ncbi:hypothetical protein MYX04_01860 [Nitrospiraceae bacterium AH_259_D15_M11_P09]|nr:hypothetical protein [Nitrospiraceae bacterium AH_259_D15_M11_P09]